MPVAVPWRAGICPADPGRASPPAAIGPLRGFYHGILAPGATWPVHIHEDLQAVTYVVSGAVEHSDSLGNRGVLTAGSVLRHWLGWGTEQTEWNPSASERAEFVQLWLQTPRPEPAALEQHSATEQRSERWLQIVQSECQSSDGLMVAQDARVHVARLASSTGPMRYRFEPGHGGYVYVIEGDVAVNLERLQAGDAAHVMSEGQVQVHALETSELLIINVPI